MSFLGGIGGSILSDVVEAGLGAMTGGMSELMTTALQGLTSAIGDDVLQQFGQSLGLGQPAIEQAQSAFHQAAGLQDTPVQSISSAVNGAQTSLGLSNQSAGQIQGQAFNASQFLQQQVQQQELNGGSSADGSGSQASGATGGQSFLLALAEALGKVIDNKMDDMVATSKQIDAATGAGNSQTATLSAQLQADSQEVGMLSSALDNAMKSLGQAAQSLASKNN